MSGIKPDCTLSHHARCRVDVQEKAFPVRKPEQQGDTTMISSIAWVPAGVAAPIPSKYEMSATERELVRLMEAQGRILEGGGGDNSRGDDNKAKNGQQQQQNRQISKSSESQSGGARKAQGKHENNLPADLRMDEYSSDEEDNDAAGGYAAGRLLVGNDDRDSVSEDQIISNNEEEESDDDMESNDSQGKDVPSKNSGQQVDDDSVASGQSNSSSGEDDEDDLADVPDTREYVPVDVEGLAAMGLSQIGGVGGRMEFDDGDDDDASYLEDVRLTNDDAIVLVAKTEEDFASLEVHVYDRKTGNLYVHHDIPLPAFPLCLAHGRVSSESSSGNFCAVGTFSPGIEVWNLDVLNALEPSCILGGEDTSSADEIMKLQMMRGGGGSRGASKKSKFSKTHKGGLRPGSHTDAVMALSWNAVHHQVIASGSADKTVKLFDVTKATSDDCNAATFTHHRDKVQSVEWHPVEGTLLATGSYDRSVALLDARSNGRDVKKVRIPSDCEAMAWDPFHTEYLTVACEDGTVNCWDVRRFETNHPAWSMLANEYGGISDVSFNKKVPGLLAFCSTDKTVSLWDTYSNSAQANQSRAHSGPPRLCGSKDMCSGKLYTVSFYPSDPWLLGCGGSGNQLALWDLSEEAAIQNRFGSLFNRGSMTESPQSPEARDTDFDAMMAPTVSSRDTRTASEHRKNKSKGKRSARKKVR